MFNISDDSKYNHEAIIVLLSYPFLKKKKILDFCVDLATSRKTSLNLYFAELY